MQTTELLLDMALDGTDDQWAALHHGCADRDFAETFVVALQHAPVDKQVRAAEWLEVIQEIHPDLLPVTTEPPETLIPRWLVKP